MKRSILRPLLSTSLLACAGLLACGDSDDPADPIVLPDGGTSPAADGGSRPPTDAGGGGREGGTDAGPRDSGGPGATYTISGRVVGLVGSGLVLQNGAETLAVGPAAAGDGGAPAGDAGAADIPFTFATKVSAYDVKVATQPKNLAQTCTVEAGVGNATADVTTVVVRCATDAFAVGGQVAGLGAGGSVTLKNNGGADLTVAANGAFAFPAKVADGASFEVTVAGASAGTTCEVTAPTGTGTLAGADVTSVRVACNYCGDGVVGAGEACDDGNANTNDACSNTCTRNAITVGGNALQYITPVLAGLGETTAAATTATSWLGDAPAGGVLLSSNDGGNGTMASYQAFLDAGNHVVLIGGTNTAEYRTFLGNYLTVQDPGGWHTIGCTPTWSRGAAHPMTTLLPATLDFANDAVSYHMVHLPAAQPQGVQVLGTSCDAADAGLLATRTYASGGTFTVMALDLGRYTRAGFDTAFVRPFLEGYLAYVRSKR